MVRDCAMKGAKMRTKSIETALLLGGTLFIVACGAPDATELEDVGSTSQALTPTQPFVRPDIYDFGSSDRTTLANAIMDFVTQPVLDEHDSGHDWHHPAVGELFFSRHHDYLNQLENYLLTNGFAQFVPVPEWDPGDAVPSEFLVADPLVSQAPMNANPNMPVPFEFTDQQLCKFANASALAQDLENWHDDVHGAVSGAMCCLDSAPGAPIFWLWHGLLDDTYHEYSWRCQTLPAIVVSIGNL